MWYVLILFKCSPPGEKEHDTDVAQQTNSLKTTLIDWQKKISFFKTSIFGKRKFPLKIFAYAVRKNAKDDDSFIFILFLFNSGDKQVLWKFFFSFPDT